MKQKKKESYKGVALATAGMIGATPVLIISGHPELAQIAGVTGIAGAGGLVVLGKEYLERKKMKKLKKVI